MMKLFFGEAPKKSSKRKSKSKSISKSKSKSRSKKSKSSSNAINTTLLRTARSKSSEVQRSNKFVSNSRLNRTQRKYCGCVMDVRTNLSKRKNMSLSRSKGKRGRKSQLKSNKLKNNPYAICYSSIRKSKKMDTSKAKRDQFKKEINPGKTNCVMNYDFDAYSLRQIQDLAKERDLPTTFKRKSDGKLTPYKKSTLASMITKSYFTRRDKRTNRKNKLRLPKRKSNSKRKTVSKKRSVSRKKSVIKRKTVSKKKSTKKSKK